MNTTTAIPAAASKADASSVKNGEILTMGGSAASAGFQELAEAYQELAIKNASRLTASMQTMATIKTPVEFFEMQRKLVTEGVDAAVADSTHIAKLTAAAFTAAFEPIRKQVAELKVM